MNTPSISKVEPPNVVAELHVQVVSQNGAISFNVGSSADLITSLGLLEMAKDALKQQSQQPKSPLIIARGNLPQA